MVVIKKNDFEKALLISRKMGLSFQARSFKWEEEEYLEILSYSKVLLASISKELMKEEIRRIFYDI